MASFIMGKFVSSLLTMNKTFFCQILRFNTNAVALCTIDGCIEIQWSVGLNQIMNIFIVAELSARNHRKINRIDRNDSVFYGILLPCSIFISLCHAEKNYYSTFFYSTLVKHLPFCGYTHQPSLQQHSARCHGKWNQFFFVCVSR